MPEVMKQMPPLPVKLNEELANTILPRTSHSMQSWSSLFIVVETLINSQKHKSKPLNATPWSLSWLGLLKLDPNHRLGRKKKSVNRGDRSPFSSLQNYLHDPNCFIIKMPAFFSFSYYYFFSSFLFLFLVVNLSCMIFIVVLHSRRWLSCYFV